MAADPYRSGQRNHLGHSPRGQPVTEEMVDQGQKAQQTLWGSVGIPVSH